MEADLTQESLTAKLNLIGWEISRATLGKIESGVRRVNDAEVHLFSVALRSPLTELYDNVTPENAVKIARHGDRRNDN